MANSTSSGHTPPTLSPLFGPLFFGLGPATLAFHHAYMHYLRDVTAMEHLILAFVRWQDLPRVSVSSAGLASNQSGSAGSLGVPVRLKEWIKGYPAMLPAIDHKKPQPRRGARTVRVMSVRRNVRMYSPDLVKTASVWAYRPAGAHGHNPLASSKEWDRIAPPTLKLAPRYSEGYKMRMSMPVGFHPDVAPGASPALKMSESYSSATSSGTVTSLPDPDYFGLGTREGEDRFRSLTDLKWGEFESMGFSGLGDEKKLQFDLTESARTVCPYFPAYMREYCSHPCSGSIGKATDLVMERLFVRGFLAHGRASQCDAAVQHTAHKQDIFLARPERRDQQEAEEDAQGAACIRVGHRARYWERGDHRGGVRRRVLRPHLRRRLDGPRARRNAGQGLQLGIGKQPFGTCRACINPICRSSTSRCPRGAPPRRAAPTRARRRRSCSSKSLCRSSTASNWRSSHPAAGAYPRYSRPKGRSSGSKPRRSTGARTS